MRFTHAWFWSRQLRRARKLSLRMWSHLTTWPRKWTARRHQAREALRQFKAQQEQIEYHRGLTLDEAARREAMSLGEVESTWLQRRPRPRF